MFDSEFYPTPEPVIAQMLSGVKIYERVFLEPSAGKGNIVDFLNTNGAKQVLTFEKNQELRMILEKKSTVIGEDFFNCKKEQVSHIHCIVINPPFSNAAKHILHAWEIAPDGCEIIAICNSNTLSKCDYSNTRTQLSKLIQDYGEEIENLGKCFSDAERKTNVSVSMIRLQKPVLSSDFDYDGFFLENDEEQTENGLVKYNEIREVVGRYIGAVKCFDNFQSSSETLLSMLSPIGFNVKCGVELSHNNISCSKSDFVKALQKHCWFDVLRKMKLNKYLTSGAMDNINKFVETQSKYPFTMRNIYRMVEIIFCMREQILNNALVEAIDYFTKYTHENRYNVEGWKTNDGHMLNKKFIVPYAVEYNSFCKHLTSEYSRRNRIDDLIKVLCSLTGVNYDDQTPLNTFLERMNCQPGTLHYWGFFKIRGFKKGTLHLEFQNEENWATLNRAYAKVKGQVLPENIKPSKKKSTELNTI